MHKTTHTTRCSQLALTIGAGLLGMLAMADISWAKSNASTGSDKPNVISFDLVPNPATIDCLRTGYNEEPRARATVVHNG